MLPKVVNSLDYSLRQGQSAHVGSDVKMAFVSSSRPACDRKLETLPSLFSHLFISGKKS